MPTKAGSGFLCLLILLLLLAVNYQNNLVFALLFLLTGTLVSSIFATFNNLWGVELRANASRNVFAGQVAQFTLSLLSGRRQTRDTISLSYLDSPALKTTQDVDAEPAIVRLALPARQRGRLVAPRIRVETVFPFGLFRAWSYTHLEQSLWVYPQPIQSDMQLTALEDEHNPEQNLASQQQEELAGLKAYREGMPTSWIDWKVFARGKGLYAREYSSPQSVGVWLDWDAMSGLDTERRLSQLCYLALQLTERQQSFGLHLPHLTIEPNLGEAHKMTVLQALAEYGQ